MTRSLPLTAILLGLLGLIPFIGCGILAMGDQAVTATAGFLALLTYGAVILSFLGGVQWGLALSDRAAMPRVQRIRYALSVVPSLIGWAALLLPLVAPIDTPLGVLPLGMLIVAFAALTVVESRATRLGYGPRGYMLLRWVLSAVVVGMLATVMAVRLLGAHVKLGV